MEIRINLGNPFEEKGAKVCLRILRILRDFEIFSNKIPNVLKQ
ncbi:hypothetical protein [Methanosarcina barkeri]|nr:hypothetical protein [Methanosarcina barkeri]